MNLPAREEINAGGWACDFEVDLNPCSAILQSP
jgi:hypothetical protein